MELYNILWCIRFLALRIMFHKDSSMLSCISELHSSLWLKCMLLYGYNTFWLSTHHLVDVWVVSIFCLLWIRLPWVSVYKSLWGYDCYILQRAVWRSRNQEVLVREVDVALAHEGLFSVLILWSILFPLYLLVHLICSSTQPVTREHNFSGTVSDLVMVD